eukprot:SAG31_NODE_2984_length_4824_cov_183.057143_1_plen_130_part_00
MPQKQRRGLPSAKARPPPPSAPAHRAQRRARRSAPAAARRSLTRPARPPQVLVGGRGACNARANAAAIALASASSRSGSLAVPPAADAAGAAAYMYCIRYRIACDRARHALLHIRIWIHYVNICYNLLI